MSRKLLLPLMLVFAAAPVWAQVGVTSGDECVDAAGFPLVLGVNAHASAGATDSPDLLDPLGCNVLGNMSADVWYTYTATDNALINVNTCTTGFDTDLVAYPDGCPVSSADQIACDGDGCAGSFASTMSWTGTAGETYIIRVGQWGAGGTGWTGEIEITETIIGGTGDILLLDWATNNNIGSKAIDCLGLTGSTTVVADGAAFDTALLTTTFTTIVIDNPSNLISAAGQTGIVDHINNGGNVFISYWALDTADPLLLAALGVASEIDITVPEAISSGVCCPGDSAWTSPNAIPGETVNVGGVAAWFDQGGYMTPSTGTIRGEFAGGQAALISDSVGGGQTFVLSQGPDDMDVQGARDLVANCIEEILATGSGPCPLLNDTCGTATTISAGVTSGTSTGAVDEGFAASCHGGASNDVWYSFTPVCDGDHTISTCGSGFDTTLAVHTDCLGTEIACNDDDCGLQSSVTITMSAGTAYLVQVSGFAGATGDFDLDVDASATAPANDDCANAEAIVAPGAAVASFNTTCATNDGPLATCGAPTATDPDVWYTYTATQDAGVVIDTCGSAFDSLLEVYDVCAPAGTVLACNDDSCGLQSSITINMLAGETITIRVTGFAGATGSGDLNITEITPTDVSTVDVVIVNGEGDIDGGLILSEVAYTDALDAAGLTWMALEPNLGTPILGCPAEGWIYNNGTFPDDAPVDADIMTIIRDCVVGGNGAIVNGGDNWGFQGPTAYDEVDGIDEAATLDGGDLVIDVAGTVGGALDGFASAYTQDQAGNDWTDALAVAAVGAGTEILGDNQAAALESPSAGYTVGVYYAHDDVVAAGAGDTYSTSVEPAGMDDPAAFLADVFGLVNFVGGPIGDIFVRGDCNQDGGFDIGDPVSGLSALFVAGTAEPACLDACDANNDGGFDIGDPVSMLSSLFVVGAPTPAAPYPTCGLDTDVSLGCITPPSPCVDL